MKILFAKGNSQYGALRAYADLLIQKMKEDKHEVVVVDRAVPGEWERLQILWMKVLILFFPYRQLLTR